MSTLSQSLTTSAPASRSRLGPRRLGGLALPAATIIIGVSLAGVLLSNRLLKRGFG